MTAILEDSSEIREAEKRYEQFTADAELRDRLEALDKFCRTHLQLSHDEEQKGLAQGVKQGKAEDKAEGVAECIQKGIEQGREEEREKLRETARKLKAKDMPIAEIVAVIDFPEEEIREL